MENNVYFDKKNIVTKSNQLIESSCKLTLQQQKIICAVASKVRITDTEFTEYTFHMKELAELLELNQKGYYAEVRKVIRSLQKQVFTIIDTTGGEIKSKDLNWFYRAEYNETKNTVSLKFAEDLKPFLLQLKENFTSYQLTNVIKLNSSYTLRLYEILKSKVFKKEFIISLSELYRMILNQYKRYTDFKKNVLERCKKEVKEKTDITFDYEEIKTGRKVTSIKFIISSNKPVSKPPKDKKIDPQIKEVQDIFTKHDITPLEASCVLKDAKENIDLIKQCYNYLLSKNVDNIVGYMRTLVKHFNKPQENKTSTFNNFKQRKYDFKELEKKLLGWE
jgi:plasmid replication initiation protein